MSDEIKAAQSHAAFLAEKWAPVLDSEEFGKITDRHRRSVTATLMENTARELGLQNQILSEAPTVVAGTGGFTGSAAAAGPVAGYDPVLISLVRRAAPNLMAYDICGVQPMTGPTGLIFAMRSRYANQTGPEALYAEANTAFSSNTGTHVVANSSNFTALTAGTGANTATAEAWGDTGNEFNQMAFSIEKVTVTAVNRALKAEYSMELAQDLKAVHGLNAEAELSNILTQELLAEINREVVRTINRTAKIGAQSTGTPGTFDLDIDANGRWLVEKFKGLMFQIEREANVIARETRRGKGNIIICSSDVASALNMAGVLEYNPQMALVLNVDDTGSTFAGTIGGRIKVYIDPYAAQNYLTIGYKGSTAFDAGVFYCPYVPLQMVRAVDDATFQPKIAFKTRYGMVANPFAGGATPSNGVLAPDSNVYYRKMLVSNLL